VYQVCQRFRGGAFIAVFVGVFTGVFIGLFITYHSAIAIFDQQGNDDTYGKHQDHANGRAKTSVAACAQKL
jgi:predicted cobalt transporter CbtA